MQAIWKGTVSFGLVSIPVKLYAATEERGVSFRQVHEADGGRIKYKRVCSVCGNEVEYSDITKGYELDDGRMVIMENEDFEKLPVKTDKSIDVLEFVPVEEIDPIFFQKTYYLEPDKAAARPYVLLRDALVKTGQLAVVKITIRQKETLATIRARDDVLVMHTMLWPDEIRKAEFDFLDQNVEVRPQELKMATSLVESMAGDFDPDTFTDDYRDALEKVIAAKAEGAELPEQPEAEEKGDVIDLMTALERSVEKAKSGRKSAKKAPPKSSAPKKKASSA
jgi:DNA end-binding protein Ku